MGETTRRRPTGIHPDGRSWQRAGVTPDHWPVRRRRIRMSWRGSWLAKYGAAARSRCIVARTSRLYRLQRTRGRSWQSGPPESALSRPALAGPAGKSFTIILAIFRNSCRWRLPAGGRPARGRVRSAAVIPADAGVQERRLEPRRGMIDTARIRGHPPRSDLMCHAGRRGHQLPDISFSIALK
jgi:hypothetical protein